MKKEIPETKFNFYTDTLFEIIEEKLNVSKETLTSKLKTREVAYLRRILVRLLKSTFPTSKLQIIGDTVNRGHSNTTLQLIEHKKLFNTDEHYTKMFRLIEFEFEKTIRFKKTLSELEDEKYELERELLVINSLIKEKELNRTMSMIPAVVTF